MDALDSVDFSASDLTALASFGPSKPYINHLRIFLIIWLLVLPPCIVATTRELTPIISVLIAYGIAKPFFIACALNDPFGQDPQDIPLNRLAADTALQVLKVFQTDPVRIRDVVRHRPPPAHASSHLHASQQGVQNQQLVFESPKSAFALARPLEPGVMLPLLAFVAWLVFVIVKTFSHVEHDDSAFVTLLAGWGAPFPLSSAVVNLISLGVFTLLGFWLNDTYNVLYSALDTWQVDLRTRLDVMALQLAVTCRPGLWHPADRERIFSFLAAVPVALKEQLRETRDLTELKGVLSPSDLHDLGRSSDMPRHCMNVLFGYLHSLDSDDCLGSPDGRNPMAATFMTLLQSARAVEAAISQCLILKKYPLSVSITNHLFLFAAFWLLVLPLTLIGKNGLFSFLCLLPVGYSLFRLLQIGNELLDPYGHDEDDVPMDVLCSEMQDSIFEIFNSSRNGPSNYVRKFSAYSRKRFQLSRSPAVPQTASDSGQPTLKRSLSRIADSFVPVSGWLQFGIVVWSCLAVALSYVLSFSWSTSRRSQCRAWCSPVDISNDILVTVGFALFMVLSFRASNGNVQYEAGAALFGAIRKTVRNLAVEIVQCFKAGTWHEGDKERLIAHLVQLPIALKNATIGKETAGGQWKGLLSEQDEAELESASCEVQYILNLLEAHMLTADCADPTYIARQSGKRSSTIVLSRILLRIYSVREVMGRVMCTKRFPCPVSYSRHQRLFAGLWLALLPFSMTPTAGLLTVVWSPLISYGVLGLGSMSEQLLDPYGLDKIDLPIRKLCTEMVSDVLEAVWSVNWDCKYHISASPADNKPYLGAVLSAGAVNPKFALPYMGSEIDAVTSGEYSTKIEFSSPHEFKENPTPYAHFLRSVPWPTLGFIFSATAVGVLLSYCTRNHAVSTRWWQSYIAVSDEIAGHVSFAGKCSPYYVKGTILITNS